MNGVMPERHEFARTAAIFLGTTGLLAWLVGTRFILIPDEGIYLDGAARILQGSLPYRDYFALTGPGTFWNLALLFRLFGVSLAVAHALLIIDLSVICASMYWLVAKLHSRALAAWTCAFYLALLAADKGSLVVNHRWDSTACCMLAATWFVHGLTSERRWPLAAAGILSAYAAWITPPMGLVAMVMLGWTAWRRDWRSMATLTAGMGTTCLAATAALWWSGSLTPFLRALFWTASQYSSANHFTYGAIIGGYSQLFDGVNGIGLIPQAALVLLVALPAVLPIVAIGIYAAHGNLRKGPPLFLALCGVAAIAGCYPRMDNGHLVYATSFWYVCSFIALATTLPSRVRLPLAMLASLGAATFALNAIVSRAALAEMSGRSGRLVGEAVDLALVQDLEHTVGLNDNFFVFPYLPVAYFVTGAANPTRYSFLQPGMMSGSDEQLALDALARSPPEKVLYMRIPASAYLRLFPSSDPTRLEMPRIEAWLGRCYQASAPFSKAHPGYELLLRRGTVCSLPREYN